MLDLVFTAITSVFAASPGPGTADRRRTMAEEVVWTLAIMGFPALDFFLVLALGPALAIPLPFVLAAVTLLLAARMHENRRLQVLAPLAALVFCLTASFFGALFSQGGFFGF
jgi:hypothetical protein